VQEDKKESLMNKNTSSNQHMINCMDRLIKYNKEDIGKVSLSAEWMEMIDRGGLWRVKNGTFYLFNVMEQEVGEQFHLSCVHQMGEGYEDSVISSIVENEEVLFHWAVLTSDIKTEEANEVLLMMIKLWTTI